jgi:hypothetical protein
LELDVLPACWTHGIAKQEEAMTKSEKSDSGRPLTREKLAAMLNEDLAREYQAIIAYVVYSQVIKGAEYRASPISLNSMLPRSSSML